MARIMTFGEIMGRLCPPGFQRFRQALPGPLQLTFGGAEANVAASLAMLGADVALVSVLPKHVIADACVGSLRGLGIDTQHVLRSDHGRLGLYFLESGANQRPSQVVYDRDGSSIALTKPSHYDWATILKGGQWLHVTGITPAISQHAAQATLDAVQHARQLGLTVSSDLNFRKKLWRWDDACIPRELAQKTMRGILPYVDVLVANEADCGDVLDIHAGETDVDAGSLDIDRYPDVAAQVVQQFPNIQKVAITLRESVSASHNNWGAMLWDASARQPSFAPVRGGTYAPYQIRNIVDRVGGGDAFAAGLIFALLTPELAAASTALEFAVAASCLAHSVEGDFNFSTAAEVKRLVHGAGSGRVER